MLQVFPEQPETASKEPMRACFLLTRRILSVLRMAVPIMTVPAKRLFQPSTVALTIRAASALYLRATKMRWNLYSSLIPDLEADSLIRLLWMVISRMYFIKFSVVILNSTAVRSQRILSTVIQTRVCHTILL